MRINNKIKNIIFDLDNTLYPHTALKKIVSADIEEILLNEKIDTNAFWNNYRMVELELFHFFLKNEINGESYMFERYYRTLCCMNNHEAHCIAEKIRDIYLRDTLSIKDEWNSKEILSRLFESGYNLYLLTNGPVRSQINKIKALRVYDFFRKIYVSDDTKLSKPDFNAFNNIVLNEKLTIANTVYVGDSLKYDIEPALNIGFKTVFLDTENGADFKDESVIRINELSQLLSVLNDFRI